MVSNLISELVDPSWELFDLERFDGYSASAESILSAVATLPVGSKRKVVIVDRVDRLNPTDQEKIAAYLPNLGSKNCLILIAGEDASKKKSSSSAKEKKADESDDASGQENGESAPQRRSKGLQAKLRSAVLKADGLVVMFEKMRANDVSALAAQIVEEHGKKIEPAARQSLSRSAQSNPSLLDGEIAKLDAWVGERDTITLADVEKVTTKSPEDQVFPLIDAVAVGRADTAVNLLGETFAASAKPDGEVLKVLALLARHFRLLYQTKYLLTEGGARSLYQVSEEQRAHLMKEQNPLSTPDWQRKRLVEQSSHFTLDELRNSLKLILLCELVLKGQADGSSSPRLNLEMLILRLSQRRGKRA